MQTVIRAALVAAALLAAPTATADVLDIAIAIIKPELKPAKPVLLCAIAGKPVLDCAKAQGMAELVNEPRVQDVLEAYGYANNKQWAKLISKVGVTAACTAFDIPAKDIFCDEYSKYVVQYGAKIVEAHAVVAKEVGGAVSKLVADGASLVTCAVGFSCPSNKPDPNRYSVKVGGIDYSLVKFNLDQMWRDCYANRIEEGVSARIADPWTFNRMVAAPSTRMGNLLRMDTDALGHQCIVKIEKDEGLFLEEQKLGLYATAWDPYAAQMNPKWRDMIFGVAAGKLETTADLFLKSTDNWLKVRSGFIAQNKWDVPLLKGVFEGEVAECARAVELPASSVAMWSENAKTTGDSTPLEGISAPQWTAKIRGWCAREYVPVLRSQIEPRLAAREKAVAGGCTPRPEGGLSCPIIISGVNGPSGADQCKIAYSGRGGACSVYALSVKSPSIEKAAAPAVSLRPPSIGTRIIPTTPVPVEATPSLPPPVVTAPPVVLLRPSSIGTRVIPTTPVPAEATPSPPPPVVTAPLLRAPARPSPGQR